MKKPVILSLSEHGRALLVQFEGRRLRAYEDPAGLLTIGVGHLLTKDELRTGIVVINGERVPWKRGLSIQETNDLLDDDAEFAAAAVRSAVTVRLNQFQFDALVCFVFNIGGSAFRRSTLLRLLNAGQYEAVPAQFRRWNKAGGRVVPGLQRRRESEAALFDMV